MTRAIYLILFLLLPFLAASQMSNLRSKNVPVLGVPLLLDSLTVIPQSVKVKDPLTSNPISPTFYEIQNNHILFDTALVAGHRSVDVVYRVFPFDLTAPFSRLDTNTFSQNPADRLIGTPYDPYAGQERPLLPQKGMDYNGNYTRGISFGNNQNLVLNSQFNLQMAGQLGDLEVLAAITDNSIPLQPEGNTQQLREFDKIFIQLKKQSNTLIAGDYELASPDGYFMKYFKKLQGATFSKYWQMAGGLFPKNKKNKPGAALQTGKSPVLNTRFSTALARGKFARNTLAAQEGNQGPYRLQGAEGERFIIVLSGTERVTLDGQLLARGLDADYVIDYNAGHVTFTNRRLITKDSRIVVEFDYNVQDFQRSLYAFNSEWKSERLRLYLHTYSEQDSRQPIDDDFSLEEQEALQLAGDTEAVVSSVDTVAEFSAFRVLYEQRDTTVGGVLFEKILAQSSDPQKQLFTASFALVGPSNGNYVQDVANSANGRVFRWTAPDPVTGQPTGDHEPVRRLVPPNQWQLYTAGGEFSPTKNTVLRAEAAISHLDKNRLSDRNDGDNSGLAATLGAKHVFDFGKMIAQPDGKPLPAKSPITPWRLELTGDLELAQQRFRELNPYRPAEFTRDWNVNNGANDVAIGERPSNEALATAGWILRHHKAGTWQYRFGGFFRDSLYTGTRHFGKYAFQKNGYDLWAQADLLETDKNDAQGGERSRFARPKLNLALPIFRDSTGNKFWLAGAYAEREHNSRFTKIPTGADTLSRASFFYDLARVYLESPENAKFGIKTSFQHRTDHAPVGSRFVQSTVAGEWNMQGHWQQSRNSRMTWNFTYRKLVIKDPELTNLDPSDTYLGRLDHQFNLLRGVLQSGTSYELGSGQERKIEITYLQVQPGEGTHQWTDRNGDGQVQLDEVEIAPFQDLANAVRVNVFTDDFIRTNNVTLNQSLRLEPKAVWFNKTGIRKFLGRFSTQTSLQITRKVRDADGVSAWNPFQLDVADTALVATRSNMHNTLFFNRSDPKFDFQIGHSDNQNKLVQTSGFESRRQQQRFLKGRWNVARSLSLQSSITFATDGQDSELLENRRYRIRSLEAKPQLTFQPSSDFRTALTWRYKRSENDMGTAGENAKTNDLKWEMVFNQSTSTSIRSELSLVDIAFEGEANSPVGFAFLQGLQNGKNYLWNVTLDRQIAKNIRLGISYEGRKTGQANVVHVGRAQVGAVF